MTTTSCHICETTLQNTPETHAIKRMDGTTQTICHGCYLREQKNRD